MQQPRATGPKAVMPGQPVNPVGSEAPLGGRATTAEGVGRNGDGGPAIPENPLGGKGKQGRGGNGGTSGGSQGGGAVPQTHDPAKTPKVCFKNFWGRCDSADPAKCPNGVHKAWPVPGLEGHSVFKNLVKRWGEPPCGAAPAAGGGGGEQR